MRCKLVAVLYYNLAHGLTTGQLFSHYGKWQQIAVWLESLHHQHRWTIPFLALA